MEYSQDLADFYAELGLSGTYGLYMPRAVELLGPLEGKHVLDYGCGVGRMSRIMHKQNPSSIVGLDISEAMIVKAKEYETHNMLFDFVDRYVSECNKFDVCLCANVVPEIPSVEILNRVFLTIFKLLKKNGVLVLTATNPKAAGYTFNSFRFGAPSLEQGGQPVDCFIRTPSGVENLFVDYYWPEQDIRDTLEKIGFIITDLVWPLANDDGTWIDETHTPPELLIRAQKQ